MSICILFATNSADFAEGNVIVAGETRKAADDELVRVLTKRWDERIYIDDDFYNSVDYYIGCWYAEVFADVSVAKEKP